MKMGDGMWQQSNASGLRTWTAKDHCLFPASHLFPRLPLLVVSALGAFHSFSFTFVAVVRVVEPQGSRLPQIRLCSNPTSFTFHPVFSKMLGYSKSATVAFLLTFLLFLGPANGAPALPEKRTMHSALRVARDGENLSQSTTVQVTTTLQT